jgi:hypothetical protein
MGVDSTCFCSYTRPSLTIQLKHIFFYLFLSLILSPLPNYCGLGQGERASKREREKGIYFFSSLPILVILLFSHFF